MARFIGGQSSFSWKYESGTYANATGGELWPGLVQNCSVSDTINKVSQRYVNGLTRSVSSFFDGATDADASFSTQVQDWRMVGFALGSIVTAGSPYVHTMTQTNNDSSNAFTSGTDAPFISFSVQDGKRFNSTGLNHLKTANGCMVDSLTINWADGEPVTMDVSAVAQSVTYSTGAAWAPTANTERPYLWADTIMEIPSGTPVRFLKSSQLSLNNNMQRDHYINGSKTTQLPYPTSADKEWTMTIDANTDWAKSLYETYFKGGSEFNGHILCSKSATRKADFYLSGCEIPTMDDPTTFEAGQEMSITIIPKEVNCVVTDGIALYSAW